MKPLEIRVKASKLPSRLFEKAFSIDVLETVFGNIESILAFQRNLLNKLDECMDNWAQNQLFGDVFVNMVMCHYQPARMLTLLL